MRAILNMRAWAALALFAIIAMGFGYLGGRAYDYEYDSSVVAIHDAELGARIENLETLACGFLQFEDFSVMPRPDDTDRLNCVGYVKGEVACDRIVRAGHEYLVNCRKS